MPDGRVRVVMPVYGHQALTHAAVRDLAREREVAEVLIVDNMGAYEPIGDEMTVRPGGNLGWAGGINFGTARDDDRDISAYLWLNNDTRLSAGFVAGLLQAGRETGAGIVGPSYDCYWDHQRFRGSGGVESYRPRRRHYRVPFLDGTAMLVFRETIDAIGLLDADSFAPIGWGAEVDYCLRARAGGLTLAVTRLSHLHHDKSATGQSMYEDGIAGYAREGFPVMMKGMTEKWGADWLAQAGIDGAAWQTRRPGLRQRLRPRRPSAVSQPSASRSPNSRSR